MYLLLNKMIIGYSKYNNDYILEIEVINKIADLYEIINKEFATYLTNKFKVISITNWKSNEHLNEIDNYKINKIIEINCNDDNTKLLDYNLIKELSIYNYFDKNEDEELYLKNKCGVYTIYHNNGQIYKTYFHNNGIEEGEYNEYTCDSVLKVNSFSINGKTHGKSTFYYNEGNLWHQTNFIMGNREGEYIEYYKNKQIREKSNFVNNKYHGKFESYYDHGGINKIGFYENDEKQGEWLSYFYSGDLCKKLYYENDELIEDIND